MVNGSKIRELREREGLLLKELAERAGVSEGMMSFVERNLREPGVTALKAIADTFGVPVDDLLTGAPLLPEGVERGARA